MEELQDKPVSRRPKDNECYQQRLPAWHPLITTGTVCPLLYILGFILIPAGALLIVASNGISEVSIHYTHCKKDTTAVLCSEEVKKLSFYTNYQTCPCTEAFNLTSPFLGKVEMYYGLTGFYQNYRKYVTSRDIYQLQGWTVGSLNVYCEPYRTWSNGTVVKQYAPCGTIANSLFNDTFSLIYTGVHGNLSIAVPLSGKNIAWPTDKTVRYGVPPASHWADTVKPVSWPISARARSAQAYSGDEDLMVWMRNAAMPTFRKLHRRVVHQGDFALGLPAGRYLLKVNYSYPVTSFDGTKRLILTTQHWLGKKNDVLGITYIVVGCILVVLAVVFTFVHHYSVKRSYPVNLFEERTD